MADTSTERNGITSFVQGIRPRVPRADELMELALKCSGRREFADRSFIRPFERLLEACDAEADLSVLGIRALRVDVLFQSEAAREPVAPSTSAKNKELQPYVG